MCLIPHDAGRGKASTNVTMEFMAYCGFHEAFNLDKNSIYVAILH
jgi:hypothetical protein